MSDYNDRDDLAERRRNKLKVLQYDKDGRNWVESEKPKETFNDVAGLEAVKKRIRMNFILPLKQPELFAAYGKEAGGSVLLFGPPGCGKTFLARAIAGEIDANFLHVELQAILGMYVGQSEQNLHDIFEKARSNNPCVIFIDELDAMGGSRNQMNHQHHHRLLVNQLLLELDGLQSANENVFVIGATNTPWYLDSALRRPGRFNHLVFVPPPNEEERETLLRLKLAGKPTQGLDLSKIAKDAKHFSGADLEQIVKDAVEDALERTLETGEIQPIIQDDMRRAAKGRRATTLDWFATAKNYATFSDVNNDYQIILEYMKATGLR